MCTSDWTPRAIVAAYTEVHSAALSLQCTHVHGLQHNGPARAPLFELSGTQETRRPLIREKVGDFGMYIAWGQHAGVMQTLMQTSRLT